MTTFQDPQPQSRRAVRQGERGDGSDTQGAFTQFPVTPPQYYSEPNAMWDTNARRAAQLPTTPRPDAAAPGRRSAASASQPPAAAEPLNYSTASRQPQNPSYDPQSFRSRLDARQAQVAPAEQTGENFRVRDFSPEGRRAAQSAEQAAVAPAWIPTTPPTDLDYQTEVREGFGLPQAPVAPPAPISQVPPQYAAQPQPQPLPVAPPPAYAAPLPFAAPQQAATPAAQQPTTHYADAPGEQTLSRRELRAMLAQQEAGNPQQLVPPAPYGQATQNAPVAWHTPEPVAPPAPQAYQATRIPEPVMPVAAPEPSTNTAMTNALAEFDALTRSQQGAAAPIVLPDDGAVWTPPVGHWSTQADLDDELPETTISRRVGSGSTMTNALVLPSIPLGSDIRGPLTGTGEIMLTGSIDLPRSLSSMGTSDRIDHSGIDSLFDMSDHEVITTDSQPVRALRAVSTHQTGHGVTHTQKPKGTRALTVLLVSASAMAVVVAGLLVAAFAFNIF